MERSAARQLGKTGYEDVPSLEDERKKREEEAAARQPIQDVPPPKNNSGQLYNPAGSSSPIENESKPLVLKPDMVGREEFTEIDTQFNDAAEIEQAKNKIQNQDYADQAMSEYEQKERAIAAQFAAKKQSAEGQAQELSKQVIDLEDRVSNQKITAPDIWGRASTGQKIMMAIGGLLSSLSNQGHKSFMDSWDKAVNDDIALQKAELEKDIKLLDTKKSVFAEALKVTGNLEKAELATKTALGSQLDKQLSYIKQKNEGRLAGINAMKALEENKLKRTKEAAELQRAINQGMYEKTEQMVKTADMTIDTDTLVGMTADPKVREKVSDIQIVKGALAELQGLYDKGAFDDYGTQSSDAIAAAKMAAGALSSLAKRSPRQVGEIEELLPTINKAFTSGKMFKSSKGSVETFLRAVEDSIVASGGGITKKRDNEKSRVGFRKK